MNAGAATEGPFADCVHGTTYTYKRGCRCDECREAKRLYRLRIREEARKRAQSGFTQFKHGYSGYRNWGCRCETCSAGHAEKLKAQRERTDARAPGSRAKKDAEWRERQGAPLREAGRRRWADEQAATLASIARNRVQWTGPELELASRPDLTAKAVALMLGRSLYAVTNMRRRLKDDPRLIRLAGLPKKQRRDS